MMVRFSLRKKTLVAVCSIVFAHFATGATAQSDIERHLGPVANFVELGTNGAWTSAVDANWYTLQNDGALGEIQYFWASQPGFEGRDFGVSTNLFTQATNDDLSHAGLIFHIRDQERYLAVTIASDGGAYVFVRSPEGLDVNRAEAAPARLDGSDLLEVLVVGKQVTTQLNGDVLFRVDVGGDGPTRNVGVFAAGSGLAAFTNMAIR